MANKTCIQAGRLVRLLPDGTESGCALCDTPLSGGIGVMYWKGRPLAYTLCANHPGSPSIFLRVESVVEEISPWPEYPALPKTLFAN